MAPAVPFVSWLTESPNRSCVVYKTRRSQDPILGSTTCKPAKSSKSAPVMACERHESAELATVHLPDFYYSFHHFHRYSTLGADSGRSHASGAAVADPRLWGAASPALGLQGYTTWVDLSSTREILVVGSITGSRSSVVEAVSASALTPGGTNRAYSAVQCVWQRTGLQWSWI